jgi:hypothetical protein
VKPAGTVLVVLSAWTALLGSQGPVTSPAAVPRPASIIGFEPCADYKLATFEQHVRYFQALAAAAPQRVRLVEIGPTVQGRQQIMAIISSERNLRELDAQRTIAEALARGRDASGPLDDARARTLAARGRAVVWIDFGLHSSEVASAQAAPLLAFDVATGESADMRSVRDNVILLLVPDMNPDGTTLVAEWYRANLGKPWESRLPELWHAYAGHDNNRDWFMLTQPESRNSARQLYQTWFPQVVYNHHQSGPFPSRIFVPPFDDPVNPDIPPGVMRGINLFGSAMTARLEREGKRGAISHIGFDTWWNGGMRSVPYFHNMIGLLTETSHPSATPQRNDPATFPPTFENGVSTRQPSTFYPSPYLGGEWHLRQSCDYMVSASMAVLDLAAARREQLLYDIYAMGRDAVAQHRDDAFLIPADQWDPGAAVKLVNVLRQGGVDVERATAAFSAGGRDYAPGTFVVRGAQPFRAFAHDLLSPQRYPDMRTYPGGPPRPPYDITGWTLSYQMGVRVDDVSGPLRVVTTRVESAAVPDAPAPPADAPFIALDGRQNDTFTAVNRLLSAGDAVYRATDSIGTGAAAFPPGAFVVQATTAARARVVELSRQYGIRVSALPARPASAHELRAPRIGVYHAWGGNMDEGWTRWVLEQFEFKYARLFDADIRAGALRNRFDTIVLPDATARQMTRGLADGSMPPQYTAGMTDAGVSNLRAFVEAGGTLVALGHASELPITAFSLPVRNAVGAMRRTDFFVPGSLLRVRFDARQPIAFGMPDEAAAFFDEDPAFVLQPGPAAATPVAVGTYADRDTVMSGWALGERLLAGRTAVADVPMGRGRVALLGFRVQHRGQPHGTFRLLFNSLYLNDIEAVSPALPVR